MGDLKLPENIEVHGKSLRIKFWWNGQLRKVSLRLPPTPSNIRIAERKLAQVEAEIISGAFDFIVHFPRSKLAREQEALNRKLTLQELYERWIAGKRANRPSTLRNYEGHYRRNIAPWFAESTVDALKLADLKIWQATLATTISRHAANKARVIFYDLAGFAVLEGQASTNPLDRLPALRVTPKPIEALTDEECSRIIDHAGGVDRALIRFALLTGMRLGELFALRTEDIDIAAQQVWVRRSRSAENGETGTKTHRERRVDLVADAVQIARAIQGQTWVFEVRQKPIPAPTFNNRWHRLLALAGVPYRHPYVMRHTYASKLISAGLPPAYIATQLGHSVSMLLSTYARWLPNRRPNLEAALNLGPSVGQ